MNRNFFIIALLGLGLILLLVNHEGGQVFGIENNMFASGLYSLIWVGVIASAVLYSGISFGQIAKYAAIWLLLIMTLMNFYLYRYELQDIGSRLTAGLIPGSPISKTSSEGRSQVTLLRDDNRHFSANASINDFPVSFIVDTGASTTTISYETAQKLGIDIQNLIFNQPISTANGVTTAAKITVHNFKIGNILRKTMHIQILRSGQLDGNLLGINFLETLHAYEVRGDRMILTD